jgi:hypothetical protein
MAMKRIVVICEGPTEKEFCDTILSPYFAQQGIYLNAPLIKHSHGGIVPWTLLLRQISIHLRAERNAYVTTMIDYYGITGKHIFPRWEKAQLEPDVYKRMAILEQGMKESVEEELRSRFIPYIQLHEFEGLLFSNINVYERVIPKGDLVGVEELKQTAAAFENPELINNSPETSPSHRLERIVRGYNKVVYGNYLAESIGLNKIRERCLRFNHWIENLAGVRDL